MFHQRQFLQQCLLVCLKYANLRKQYLTNYYCRWPSVEKFENLMSSKSQKNSINSSKYIYFGSKFRSKFAEVWFVINYNWLSIKYCYTTSMFLISSVNIRSYNVTLILLYSSQTKQKKEHSMLLGSTTYVLCGRFLRDSQFHDLNYFFSVHVFVFP